MSIERKTEINQIEILRDGTLQIRIALLLVEDDKIIDTKWHRTSIPLSVPPGLQMNAVNEHLAEMGMQPVSGADIARVSAFHNCSQMNNG